MFAFLAEKALLLLLSPLSKQIHNKTCGRGREMNHSNTNSNSNSNGGDESRRRPIRKTEDGSSSSKERSLDSIDLGTVPVVISIGIRLYSFIRLSRTDYPIGHTSCTFSLHKTILSFILLAHIR